jgi:hypothetical protein
VFTLFNFLTRAGGGQGLSEVMVDTGTDTAIITVDYGRKPGLKGPGQVWFLVHNPGFIAAEVQPQVFTLSFSTKGAGRGLGTYGMRLLSERFLSGRVEFESHPTAGTTFTVTLPFGGLGR